VDILYRRIFCRWALRVSLEISYSSTFGAGGFSISPKLEFRAIVPKESQIFICLHTAEESLKSRDVSTVIQNTYNALIEAFCAGEASMTDTLQSGDGILHVSILKPINYRYCRVPHRDIREIRVLEVLQLFGCLSLTTTTDSHCLATL
jgi:hypothetical protein